MIPIIAQDFNSAAQILQEMLRGAPPVRTERWQGMDVSRDPAATSYELRNVAVDIPLGTEDLEHWRSDIQPNLPWADDHFLERIGGEPLNPGVQWANWPWAKSANRFRSEEQFNHTYMERLWPKYARTTDGGRLPPCKGVRRYPQEGDGQSREGIGWSYGDLQNLVEMLADEPHTRQAYIPLFFPEDTGVGDGGRKPCTLGYQLMVRDRRLSIFYPMRSVDFIRHFRDDCYLAVRLLLWIMDRCREINPDFWLGVRPGDYSMWMTSLHVFENDKRSL